MASNLEFFEWEARRKLVQEAQAEQARQLEIIRRNNPKRFEELTGKPAQTPIFPRDTGNPWADDWGVGPSTRDLQKIIDNRGFDEWREQLRKDNVRNFEEFQGIQEPQKYSPQNDFSDVWGENKTKKFKPVYGPSEWKQPGESFTYGTGMGGTPKTYQDVPFKPSNPGFTWGTGRGGTLPNGSNQSDLRQKSDIERNRARDYGPQTPERFGDWENRVDQEGKKWRDAQTRKNIPSTRDLGYMDPRRLDFEPGSLSGRKPLQNPINYGVPDGNIGPNQNPIELERQARQRELTRLANKQRTEMDAFQKSQANNGKSAGSNWVSDPIQSNSQRFRDEIKRLQDKFRPQEELEARRRINAERDRFKKTDYDSLADRARKLAESERMANNPQEITGSKPIGGRTISGNNIKPFKVPGRDFVDKFGGSDSKNGPSNPFERDINNKRIQRGQGPLSPVGGIDYKEILRKADPRTITGLFGEKNGKNNNKGPIASLERPPNKSVLAPKVSNPFKVLDPRRITIPPKVAEASRQVGKGIGAGMDKLKAMGNNPFARGVGKVIGAIGKPLAVLDVADSLRKNKEDLEDLYDQFRGGKGRNLEKKRKAAGLDENGKRIPFDPRNDNFSGAGKEFQKFGKSFEDFINRDLEAKRKKRIQDDTDKYFKSDEHKRNRRRWDTYDPYAPENNKRRDMPKLPFNPFPPGQPGGPILPRPPIKGWETITYHVYTDPDDSRYNSQIYIKRVFLANSDAFDVMNSPQISGDDLVHQFMYQERYISAFSLDTFGVGLPVIWSGGSLEEIKTERGYKEKWDDKWEWDYRDERWSQIPSREFEEWYKDKFFRAPNYGKFTVQDRYNKVSIVSNIPIFDGEPGTRPKPDKDRKKPREDDEMGACKYMEDQETQTQLDYYDPITKRIGSKGFSIHRGTDEAFEFLAAQVAQLSKNISNIADVLEVNLYKAPQGKVVTPVLSATAYQTVLSASPAAAVPLVKTLPGEMAVFSAMNHMFSGHHLLGKIQLPVNPADSKSGTMTPLTIAGLMLKMHDSATGMVGIPSMQSTVTTTDGKETTKISSFKNATDAIENVNGQVQGLMVDMSAVQEMCFKMLQNQETLINMVHKETYKTTVLIKDAGCRITEQVVPRPGVMTHGKKKEANQQDDRVWEWGKTFVNGTSYTSVPVWKDDLDKMQLGIKTNMEAQKAAASVFFPINSKGNIGMPQIQTGKKQNETEWLKFVKTINEPTGNTIYNGTASGQAKIEYIEGTITKPIITGDVPFIGVSEPKKP